MRIKRCCDEITFSNADGFALSQDSAFSDGLGTPNLFCYFSEHMAVLWDIHYCTHCGKRFELEEGKWH